MFQILRKQRKNSVASVIHLITDYRLLMTMSALALNGCMGVYEGGFECPPGRGVGCKSISEVNEMVDQYDSGAEISVAESRLNERAGSPQIWFNPRFGQCEDSEFSCPSKLIPLEVRDAKNSI